jgi:hypothetical protein
MQKTDSARESRRAKIAARHERHAPQPQKGAQRS